MDIPTLYDQDSKYEEENDVSINAAFKWSRFDYFALKFQQLTVALHGSYADDSHGDKPSIEFFYLSNYFGGAKIEPLEVI